MDASKLSAQIKKKARELGFSMAGVCLPGEMASYERYAEWMEAGYQADMDYLAREKQREKRLDPRRVMPDCKSILVLAAPYSKPDIAQAEGRGRVAAYAWGKDYHEVLKGRLQELVEFIEKQVGEPVANRSYTDTGPILERELAQRAGLGWIGKNSMLINPAQGSYFLLAEILLGIELAPDNAFASDNCGTCTRCIEACPTDCILPNRTLDAARCISYLTIENKGSIAPDLRAQMGNWIFGCDICQQVCPWNVRFAPQQGEPLFEAAEGSPYPVLDEHLNLNQVSFAAIFKGRPQKRAKRRGYLRNLTVAMGNSGSTDHLAGLARSLGDEEALVRGHSAWAIGQIGDSEGIGPLEEALETERESEVRGEIKAAVKRLRQAGAGGMG